MKKILIALILVALISTTAYAQYGGGGAWGSVVAYLKRVAVHIWPSVDNTYDLGSSTKEWRNLYVNGTAYIDALGPGAAGITLDNVCDNESTTDRGARFGDLINPQIAGHVRAEKMDIQYRSTTPIPLVTFQFDDANDTDYDVMKPVFDAQGEVACSAITTGRIGDADKLTWAELTTMENAGWEIMSHTQTHPDLTGLSDEELITELGGSKDAIEAQGLTVNNFVNPYGYTDENVRSFIRRYYRSARSSTISGQARRNLSILNTYSLSAYHADDATEQDMKDEVDTAETNNEWLVFYMHTTDGDDATKVGNVIDYIQGKGISIITTNQALDLIETVYETGDMTAGRGFAVNSAGDLRAGAIHAVGSISIWNPAWPIGHDVGLYYHTGHLGLRAYDGDGTDRDVLVESGTVTFRPGSRRATELGESTYEWATVWATGMSSSVDDLTYQSAGDILFKTNGDNLRLTIAADGVITATGNIITTGDITIDSDSSLLRLGDTPASDYTIGWDGSDAVHTITAGDFVFTGGKFGINDPAPAARLDIILEATDADGVNINGATNAYTGTGIGIDYAFRFDRYLNAGDGNEPTNFYLTRFQNSPRHTDGDMNGNAKTVRTIHTELSDAATAPADHCVWSNAAATNETLNYQGIYTLVDLNANLNTTGAGRINNYNTAYFIDMKIDPIFDDDGVGVTSLCRNIGNLVTINSTPTITSGNVTHTNYGHYIDVVGDDTDGGGAMTTINRGIHIQRVSGSGTVTNYAIFDISDAEWWLRSDTAKFNLGETITDLQIYSDGTDGQIDAATNIDIHPAGVTTLGDGGTTNYAQFAADGELTLAGTARVNKEFSLLLTDFNPGASGPTKALNDIFPTFEFTIDDDMHTSFEMPDNWATGTDITVEVYWAIDEAYATNSGEVRWSSDWRAVAVGEVISAGASGTMDFGDVNIPATANAVVKTTSTISGASLAADDLVAFNGARVDLVGGSNPTAEPYIIAVRLQYIADKLGEST